MTAWPDLPPLPALQVLPPIPAPALPHVVGSVAALRHLPHMTILKVQSGAAAQVNNDDAGHYLTYAGTDEIDSLDPTDLFWDRSSMDSLVRMLPAVILEQGQS
jgi:hypothetical protein